MVEGLRQCGKDEEHRMGFGSLAVLFLIENTAVC